MAKAVKDFVRKIFPSSLFEKGDTAHHGSKEYLYVENQEDSGEEEIVYPSEEMTTNSKEAEKSQNTSALQAAWNVLNLIQGTVIKTTSNYCIVLIQLLAKKLNSVLATCPI